MENQKVEKGDIIEIIVEGNPILAVVIDIDYVGFNGNDGVKKYLVYGQGKLMMLSSIYQTSLEYTDEGKPYYSEYENTATYEYTIGEYVIPELDRKLDEYQKTVQ